MNSTAIANASRFFVSCPTVVRNLKTPFKICFISRDCERRSVPFRLADGPAETALHRRRMRPAGCGGTGALDYL